MEGQPRELKSSRQDVQLPPSWEAEVSSILTSSQDPTGLTWWFGSPGSPDTGVMIA